MRTMLLTVSVVLVFVLGARTGCAQDEAVKVIVKPDPVYIERSESGQHLNYDFLLENRTALELILTSVEVSVFDAQGQLLRRDFVDRFSRVSLELTRRRALRPNRAFPPL